MATLKPALNLMRRLPPSELEDNLMKIVSMVPPSVSEELLARVDQPLVEQMDTTAARKFLICDYNRDGDSFRSPWSNEYFPPIEDGEGIVPSEEVRALEDTANKLFEAYCEQYFGAANSLSSVYFWDNDDGFSGCWLIKKHIPSGGRFVEKGCWDSIHVTEAKQMPDRSWVYKLTTTIMLSMSVAKAALGTVEVHGSLNRQTQHKFPADKDAKTPDHLARLGTMIENMESDMRSNMEALYISKTREVVSSLRCKSGAAMQGSSAHVAALTAAVKEVQAGRPVDSDV